MNNAMYNSNTFIGYKLSFFSFIEIVDTLIALIDVGADHLVIDHFNNDDIVNMINEVYLLLIFI